MPLVDLPANATLDGGTLTDLPPDARLDTPTDIALRREPMPGLSNQPYTGPTIGQAARSIIPNLAQTLSAAYQRTSPVVEQIGGKPNYMALGEAGPLDSGGIGWIDQSGMHKIDPSKHVILSDPSTGKPTVYLRNSAPSGVPTDENALTSLGRLLGFGATAPSNISQPAQGVLSTGLNIARNRFAPAEDRALSMIGSNMRADMAVGGPGPQGILDDLTKIGPPGTVLDVAGENVRALGGQAARVPGPGRQNIVSTLNARDAGAGVRLTDATSDMAANGPGTYMAQAALDAQKKTAAVPLYRQFEAAPALNPDHLAPDGELTTLLRRPSMRDAAKNALKTAAEEGRDPASLGISFNEAGDPVFQRVPSWRTLQDLKGGVDDVLEGYGRNPITGRLELDTRGRAVDQTRRALIDFMDRNNEFYAPARAAYAGPAANRDALEQGARIFNQAPDAIAAQMANLTPAQQEFYRLGAANALKTKLASTSSGGDEARALIGNELQMQRLRAVFPRAEELIDRARAEKTMFDTRFQTLGGSQTAPRLAQDAGGTPAGDLLRAGLDATVGYVMNEPVFATRSAFNALKAFLRDGRMTPEVAQHVAGRLLTGDPATAKGLLDELTKSTTVPYAPPQPILPWADLGAREFALQPGERGRR